MPYDPIPDIEKLGYTWRESAFLYLVGTNSGFFLSRQYCEFLARKLGALIQRVAEKGTAYGHIETLGYGQRRHVYHLKSRALYELFGDEEYPGLRTKGDAEIKTRLMVLDYVLAHRSERFLAVQQDKIDFFLNACKVPKETLPRPTRSLAERYFPERFPIYCREASTTAAREIRFTYFDCGASGTKRFVRFLNAYKPLAQELGSFAIHYIADSQRNLLTAERAFNRAFPKASKLLPFGREHIAQFFDVEALWNRKDPRFNQQDLAVLTDGEKVYTLPEHKELRTAWLRSRKDFDVLLARLGGKQVVRGRFSSEILKRTYPIFGHRYRGIAPEGTVESRFGSTSNFNSIAS